jgi:hypothetical protein
MAAWRTFLKKFQDRQTTIIVSSELSHPTQKAQIQKSEPKCLKKHAYRPLLSAEGCHT